MQGVFDGAWSLTWIQISSPAIALGFGAAALVYVVLGRRKFERQHTSRTSEAARAQHPAVVELERFARTILASEKSRLWPSYYFDAVLVISMIVLTVSEISQIIASRPHCVALGAALIGTVGYVVARLFERHSLSDVTGTLDQVTPKEWEKTVDNIKADQSSQ